MDFFNTFLPSYTPSIVRYSGRGGCDLAKSVYNLEDGFNNGLIQIKNIYVYLKLQFVEHNISLHTYVSLDGKRELTCEEWNTLFVENFDNIRNFFNESANYTTMQIVSNDLHLHTTSRLVLLLTSEPTATAYPITINQLEWTSMEHVMGCINVRIKHLNKIKSTYENRMNFFKKRYKIQCPISMQEANQIMDGLCNNDDIIDS